MKKRAHRIKPEYAFIGGAEYEPFIKGYYFGSRGVAGRTYHPDFGRILHTLSMLELRYLLVLVWTRPRDIRDQFPLPLADTVAIAHDLGVQHPTDRKTHKLTTEVTTDFFVAWGPTETESLALAVKPAQELADRRTVEKLHIEYEYWRRKGVPWAIGTERDLPEAAVHNLEWFAAAYESTVEPRLADAAEEILAARLGEGWPPFRAGLDVDHALQLPAGTGLRLIRHFLATRRWSTDMAEKIHPARPLKIHRVAVKSPVKSHENAA